MIHQPILLYTLYVNRQFSLLISAFLENIILFFAPMGVTLAEARKQEEGRIVELNLRRILDWALGGGKKKV
jgi:hypothetical protein